MVIENIEIVIDKLVKAVVEDKVEAEIEIRPDGMDIRVEPWKHYEMKCPYRVEVKPDENI